MMRELEIICKNCKLYSSTSVSSYLQKNTRVPFIASDKRGVRACGYARTRHLSNMPVWRKRNCQKHKVPRAKVAALSRRSDQCEA